MFQIKVHRFDRNLRSPSEQKKSARVSTSSSLLHKYNAARKSPILFSSFESLQLQRCKFASQFNVIGLANSFFWHVLTRFLPLLSQSAVFCFFLLVVSCPIMKLSVFFYPLKSFLVENLEIVTENDVSWYLIRFLSNCLAFLVFLSTVSFFTERYASGSSWVHLL